MEIVINKEKIVENLHKMSAHIGSKLSAPELVASTADDEGKIELMLSDSLVDLLKLLSPYATIKHTATTVIYELDMPANWKSGRVGNLSALCENFILHSLFAAWLDYIKSDAAALHRTLNSENVVAIRHILSLREKPKRE